MKARTKKKEGAPRQHVRYRPLSIIEESTDDGDESDDEGSMYSEITELNKKGKKYVYRPTKQKQ